MHICSLRSVLWYTSYIFKHYHNILVIPQTTGHQGGLRCAWRKCIIDRRSTVWCVWSHHIWACLSHLNTEHKGVGLRVHYFQTNQRLILFNPHGNWKVPEQPLRRHSTNPLRPQLCLLGITLGRGNWWRKINTIIVIFFGRTNACPLGGFLQSGCSDQPVLSQTCIK